MAQTEKERRERIREGRSSGARTGVGPAGPARAGHHRVQSLPPETISKVMATIRNFDDFTEHNDPYGEHDCAAVEVDGSRVFWKIDYYDKARQGGSPDPSDPNVTERVMTIMLGEEY